MAQRKPPPSGSKNPSKATSKSYVSAAKKPVAGASAARPPGARPPAKRPGKSIVNQKQTPWGLIITTVAVVVFAAAVVVAVIVTRKSSSDKALTSKGGQAVSKNDPYRQPALAAAMTIKGVTYQV